MAAILRFLFPMRSDGNGADWLLLVARIVFGALLLTHGVAKWMQFENLSGVFPDPLGVGHRSSLLLAIFAEVVCSAGFIAGLFYRLALIPIIVTLCAAFFSVHGGEPFAARELSFVYLTVFVLLYAAGPGRFAVDRLFAVRAEAMR